MSTDVLIRVNIVTTVLRITYTCRQARNQDFPKGLYPAEEGLSELLHLKSIIEEDLRTSPDALDNFCDLKRPFRKKLFFPNQRL